MSHASGIEVPTSVEDIFAKAWSSDTTRLLQLAIEDEMIVHVKTLNVSSSFEEDFDKMLLPLLEQNSGGYFFVRRDSKNDQGFDWIFIVYVPDTCKVRYKMLYSSTKAEVKKQFGSHRISSEMFGTVPADVNLNGFMKHLKSEAAPAPLTMQEEEKAEIKSREVGVDIGASTKRTLVRGVAFPASAVATEKLKALVSGSISYVQLSLDMEKETVELEVADNTDIDNIAGKTPSDHPRYHFIRYAHQHEGENLNSIGYACKVKERMLYSSCKDGIIDIAEEDCSITFDKKLEVGDLEEITLQFVQDALHPPPVEKKKAFSKPKRPGQGARRMIK